MIKKLLKNNNILSLANTGIVAVLSFLNIALLSRMYSKEIFGQWALFLAGFSFVNMFLSGFTGTPLVKFLAGSKSAASKQAIINTFWTISVCINILLIVIIILCYQLFESIQNSGFSLFFLWYPLTALLYLPVKNSMLILQAESRFKQIVILRIIGTGLFSALLGYIFIRDIYLRIEHIAIYYSIFHGITSVVAISMGWGKIKLLFFMDIAKDKLKQLFNFGKYSLGTLIGSNLLRSSDTILIGLFLGEAQVAIYSIPLKLIEVLEIPLRSFTAVALPKMSKASSYGDTPQIRNIFYKYSGLLSICFIPLLIGLFFFGEHLIALLGGDKYVATETATNIFRIFLIYGLFLSIDRFTGVTLDSINKPNLNFVKVVFMATANIVGDLVIVMLWPQLELVATITIINVLVGVFLGLYFLNKEISIKLKEIPVSGFLYIKEIITKVKQTFLSK